jgi:hypothetical protein
MLENLFVFLMVFSKKSIVLRWSSRTSFSSNSVSSWNRSCRLSLALSAFPSMTWTRSNTEKFQNIWIDLIRLSSCKKVNAGTCSSSSKYLNGQVGGQLLTVLASVPKWFARWKATQIKITSCFCILNFFAALICIYSLQWISIIYSPRQAEVSTKWLASENKVA